LAILRDLLKAAATVIGGLQGPASFGSPPRPVYEHFDTSGNMD
jgi:hypothetical protein